MKVFLWIYWKFDPFSCDKLHLRMSISRTWWCVTPQHSVSFIFDILFWGGSRTRAQLSLRYHFGHMRWCPSNNGISKHKQNERKTNDVWIFVDLFGHSCIYECYGGFLQLPRCLLIIVRGTRDDFFSHWLQIIEHPTENDYFYAVAIIIVTVIAALPFTSSFSCCCCLVFFS